MGSNDFSLIFRFISDFFRVRTQEGRLFLLNLVKNKAKKKIKSTKSPI